MKQPFNYPQDLITLSFFLHESQNVPHLSCNIQGSCSCSREKKPKQEKETWHEMQQLNETCVKNFPRHKNHPDLTALFLEQLSLLLTMLFPTKIYCFRWQGPPACFFGYFDIFIALDVGGVVDGELQRLPLPILHVQTDRNMASLVVARLPCAQTIACLLTGCTPEVRLRTPVVGHDVHLNDREGHNPAVASQPSILAVCERGEREK